MAVVLIAGLLGSLPGISARAGGNPPPIDPDFLEYIQAHPGDVFTIIVQQSTKNGYESYPDPDQEVVIVGGTIRINRDFISSFSAELSGAEIAKLALNPKVRWISYDGLMFSTSAASKSFTNRTATN